MKPTALLHYEPQIIDQSFTITYDDNNYSVTTADDLNTSANEVII